MVRKAALIILALAAVAGPAMAEDQFDLICTGTAKTQPNGFEQGFIETYRIDLAAKRICWGKCIEPMPILSVTADRITIKDIDDRVAGGMISHFYFSRTEGTLAEYGSSGTYPYNKFWLRKATCTVAPFSGMPAAKF